MNEIECVVHGSALAHKPNFQQRGKGRGFGDSHSSFQVIFPSVTISCF